MKPPAASSRRVTAANLRVGTTSTGSRAPRSGTKCVYRLRAISRRCPSPPCRRTRLGIKLQHNGNPALGQPAGAAQHVALMSLHVEPEKRDRGRLEGAARQRIQRRLLHAPDPVARPGPRRPGPPARANLLQAEVAARD